MKNDLRLMMVTDLEADLIEAARNYVRSYPDGNCCKETKSIGV